MDPTLTTLTTVAGVATIATILVQIILTTWKPSPDDRDRFGPLVALVVAVIVAEIGIVGLGLGTRADFIGALLTGIVAGGGSMGIHDTAGAVTG